DRLYLVGGADLAALTPRMDLSVATVQADGSLGPFSTVSGVTLTSPRIGCSLAVVGDFLYVMGGSDPNNNNVSLTSLERAPIAADGSLGAFQAYPTSSLATGRYLASPAIVGSTLYVMGGFGSGVPVATVDEAQVDSSGSISFFFRSGSTSLTSARSDFKIAVLGGFVWAFGGIDATVSVKTIDRAAIATDNTLGSFSVQRDGSNNQMFLSTERALPTAAVIGDDLYLVAGVNNNGSPPDPGLSNVDHATIAADGTVGAFAIPAGATLPEGVFFHFGAAVGNFVYVLGGGSHLSTTTPSEVKQALLP
ncbi:MAG TPA: hypothetical protein VIV58_14575, partial [Kofleriaceae bacterium]